MSRIEELFQDIAEEFARGNRQEREYSRSEIDTSDLIKDDALLLSTLAGLGTAPVAVPAWLSRFAAGPLNKAYGAVGGDMSKMIIPPLSKLGRRFRNQDTPSSGARVGQDARREIIPPLTKTGQRTTNRGPRGNTNIDVPANPPSAPPPGTRNTGGLTTTDQAMIKAQQDQMLKPRGTGDFMLPKNPRHRAKEVEKVIWNKDRFPKQSDRIANRRPANAEEVNMIKAQDEGIMNTSPGKSYMEELGDLRRLEQQTNRKNILQNRVATKQAQQDLGELVDMEVFFKEQAELAELTKLLD